MLGRQGTPAQLTPDNAVPVMGAMARLLLALGFTPWVPGHDRSGGARRVRAITAAAADAAHSSK